MKQQLPKINAERFARHIGSRIHRFSPQMDHTHVSWELVLKLSKQAEHGKSIPASSEAHWGSLNAYTFLHTGFHMQAVKWKEPLKLQV